MGGVPHALFSVDALLAFSAMHCATLPRLQRPKHSPSKGANGRAARSVRAAHVGSYQFNKLPKHTP